MRRTLLALVLFAAAEAATAAPARVPLPPKRPDFEGAKPAPAPVPSPSAPGPAPTAGACVLAHAVAKAASAPPSEIAPGDGATCGIPSPVRLEAVLLDDGSKVTVSPAALLDCRMAGQLVSWVRDDVAPLARQNQLRLTEVEVAGSYECRGRNRVATAKTSEHALGNAVDISGLRFDKAASLTVGKDKSPLWEGLRNSACARFETVLGPGSDAEHGNHLHLDMRERKTPHLICQWTLN